MKIIDKSLSEDQNIILNQLVNEFKKINDTPLPKTNGLINIGQIKENIIARDKFIAECTAEELVYTRLVDKQVRKDAEKLRADLNELGLDVWYRTDGYCTKYFAIIKKGEVDEANSLETIGYDVNTYIDREKLGKTIRVSKSFKVRCKGNGQNYNNTSYFDTIEDLTKYTVFQKRLETYYEKLMKS